MASNMFSRVILRRIDPAAAASSRADDIENQPLSPRGGDDYNAPAAPAPEMTERGPTNLSSRLGLRRPSIASRFRFSSSTEATSSVGTSSDWHGSQTTAPTTVGTATANGRTARANTQPRPSSSHYPDEDEDEYDPDLGSEVVPLPSRYSVVVDLPSTRLHLPGLQRTWTQGSNGPPTARAAPAVPTIQVARAVSPPCRPHTPPAAVMRDQTRLGSTEADELYPVGDQRSRGNFTAPEEAQLAGLVDDGRRRRRDRRGGSGSGSGRSRQHRHRRRENETPEEREARRRRRRERQRLREIEEEEAADTRPHPKHFLFCFPWVKSRKVRSQILQCFVSGMFLILLLSVYLALSATKNISNSEFSVLIILIILFATIFFAQGLIRLCLLIFRPKPSADQQRRNMLPRMYGPGGYAVPRQPIRVVLARDEEAAGIESETTKMQPPAYGLWRESVRVDPNRIYWQRNTQAPEPTVEERVGDDVEDGGESSSSGEEGSSSSRPRNGPRPPSYASEDGVSYVVEARPRSIAPSALGPEIVQVPMALPSPMPVHPSEVGRLGRAPSR